MLRGIIICPDVDLSERLQQALADTGHVFVSRLLDRYPNAFELTRLLRAHAPQVVFLGVESIQKTSEIVKEVDKQTPGVQIVAVGRQCDPQMLLDVMRAGIREFASLPFDLAVLTDTLARIGQLIDDKPPVIETSDLVFSFLPSKAGVGTSTTAVNAAVALGRIPNTRVLLNDFDLNSGMIRFMLKLDNSYGVVDAAEHALHMDESMWPQMVTTVDGLDVLHAGRLNPNFHIEPTQIRHLIDFMRRNYQVLCFDLSGNLEKYSLEIMHESKKIFLVCTPEIPSLHLAREKYVYLKQVDLHDRVCILLNRAQKRPVISTQQIEELLGLPIQMSFPNDYQGVHRALTLGRSVDPASDLGRQYANLANIMLESRPKTAAPEKKKFLEYFSVVPTRLAATTTKKAV